MVRKPAMKIIHLSGTLGRNETKAEKLHIGKRE